VKLTIFWSFTIPYHATASSAYVCFCSPRAPKYIRPRTWAPFPLFYFTVHYLALLRVMFNFHLCSFFCAEIKNAATLYCGERATLFYRQTNQSEVCSDLRPAKTPHMPSKVINACKHLRGLILLIPVCIWSRSVTTHLQGSQMRLRY